MAAFSHRWLQRASPQRSGLSINVSTNQCLWLDAGEPLPFEDGAFDAVYTEHMFEHMLPVAGATFLREAYRVVRPGGSVVVVDFVAHQHEWMRDELGVTWLGFRDEEVRGWFDHAHLEHFLREDFEGLTAGRDLPATFIASARKPA